jgi:hypothetical protein
VKPTKTARSRRRIDLSPDTLALPAEHRKAALAAGRISSPVFHDTAGGYLRLSNLVKNSFKPILVRAGLPLVGLYTLRHACATLLLLADQPAKVVSERLGHSSVTLTLDTYSHVLPTMQTAGGGRDEQNPRCGEGAQGAGVVIGDSQATQCSPATRRNRRNPLKALSFGPVAQWQSRGLIKHLNSENPRISWGFCIWSDTSCPRKHLPAGVNGCQNWVVANSGWSGFKRLPPVHEAGRPDARIVHQPWADFHVADRRN